MRNLASGTAISSFQRAATLPLGQFGDGHASALIQATIIVAPIRLEVCDGRHTLIVMNKGVVSGSAAWSARGGF